MKLADHGPVVEHEPTKREAWEAMDFGQQQALLDIAGHVMAVIELAYVNAARYIVDQGLDDGEYIALWTRFGSCDRSALKKGWPR